MQAPRGGNYYVDFRFIGLKLLGEVDGDVKYTDSRMRRGRTPEEVFFDEKAREDWIRGKTESSMIRWGFPHSRTARDLGARLRAFNVPAP